MVPKRRIEYYVERLKNESKKDFRTAPSVFLKFNRRFLPQPSIQSSSRVHGAWSKTVLAGPVDYNMQRVK